jgi:hypothetical protein
MNYFVDFFRRGDVARDVKLLAARGALAPSAAEQLALLVLLTEDPDPDVSGMAMATLDMIPPASIAAFIGRPDVSDAVRSFYAARGIAPSADPAAARAGDEPASPDVESGPEDEDEGSTLTRIGRMNVSQRIKLAMKGSREERAILIRDPNRIVAVAVLSSPKLSDTEVEGIARMGSVSEDVLRMIAHTRAWVKNYPVVLALTRNAKTPVGISMNLLSRLNERDLRLVSQDRNVPEVLRITARKKIVLDK